jgi:hypothetical protein
MIYLDSILLKLFSKARVLYKPPTTNYFFPCSAILLFFFIKKFMSFKEIFDFI